MALSLSQINAIKDFGLRTVLLGMYKQLDLHNQVTGTNFVEPTNSPQEPAGIPPSAPSISVAGTNGVFSVTIAAPSQSVNKIIYYEISYSPKSNFVGPGTVLPPTTNRFVTIPAPGLTVYFRARASYDQHNWSEYSYA
jgi:hypothetical protein